MADEFDKLPPETQRELGRLLFKMSRNKDTRRPVLQTIKKVDPEYMLPGDQQVEDLRQEFEEREEKRTRDSEQKAVNERLEAQRRGLMDGTLLPGRKFDEAQIKEIEDKVMPKYGIADYEAAAKIYASDLKPEKPRNGPVNGHGATWTFPDIPGLMDDPTKASREAAHAVIDEFNGTRH